MNQKTARIVTLAAFALAACVPMFVRSTSTHAVQSVETTPARVAAPVVIDLPAVTIVGEASKPAAKRSHGVSGAARGSVSAAHPSRSVALDQGGRPGARSVRVWGAF